MTVWLERHTEIPINALLGLLVAIALVANAIVWGRVWAEQQKAAEPLPATITVTCPAPRDAEALVITVTSAGRHHCGIYTGRAY